MPMKEWFRKLQPVQLYVILALTVVFFAVELTVSHVTHALTLLIDSYHMLCNILALAGCIFTIKYGHKEPPSQDETREFISKPVTREEEELTVERCVHKRIKMIHTRAQQERKLKNTFGWARIDVIAMLICCVFMASLCFSLLVEALQTLVHINHHDEMHHPIPVLCIGGAGLLLNGICYLLIGGYTFHQGSFLYVTESGDVVLDKVVISNSIQKGERRLSRTRINVGPNIRQRQGFREMCRDVSGCFFVIICAVLVYFTDKEVAKFIDPAMSIVSALTLICFSYPYMKESCLILLQTIPASVNINSLHADLLKQFPDIVNVHDLHIWQLTANKVISTVHIIFQNPMVYAIIVKDVKEFFIENGITQVTIQPEFFKKSPSTESLPSINCLMQCQGENCKLSHCCPDDIQHKKKVTNIIKAAPKEKLPSNLDLNLKSIKILNDELTSSSSSLKSYNGSVQQSSDSCDCNEQSESHRAVSRAESEISATKDEEISVNKGETITDKTENPTIAVSSDEEAS